MTFRKYIKDVAPEVCGVHPAFGKVAELVFDAEIAGDTPEFSSENFVSSRERAELAAPYTAKNENAREHVIDVVELAICSHRQANHEEDHAERIEYLKGQDVGADEIEMAVRDWWNE